LDKALTGLQLRQITVLEWSQDKEESAKSHSRKTLLSVHGHKVLSTMKQSFKNENSVVSMKELELLMKLVPIMNKVSLTEQKENKQKCLTFSESMGNRILKYSPGMTTQILFLNVASWTSRNLMINLI
jgi:hypothetical protein